VWEGGEGPRDRVKFAGGHAPEGHEGLVESRNGRGGRAGFSLFAGPTARIWQRLFRLRPALPARATFERCGKYQVG